MVNPAQELRLEPVTDPRPSPGAILERYPFHARDNRCFRQLCELLSEVDPGASLEARLDHLSRLGAWLCARGPLPLLDGQPKPKKRNDRNHDGRFALLLRILDEVPGWQATFASLVTGVLAETSALTLLLKGIPNDRGFRAETNDRLSRRFLPQPVDLKSLAQTLARTFRTERDALWLGGLDPKLTAEFVRLCGDAFGPVRAGVADAASLLALRVSALGLAHDIRERGPETPPRESPFHYLPRAVDSLLAGAVTGEDLGPAAAACRERIAECRAVLILVHQNLEARGVSVDVVYRLEVIEKCLVRLEQLLPLILPGTVEERGQAATQLLGKLMAARIRDRSLRDLLRSNVRLLAQKIIERAGETGEHYITSSRKEWWGMILSAGGGGFLTAGTVLLKFLIMWGHFPLFVEGALSSANYAASFVLMQLLGMTLATKQPSMTAAALAGSLKECTGAEHELDELVKMIARICRSQLAAAIGNIGMVIPVALGVHLAYMAWKGHPFLDEHSAEHMIQSLDATKGITYWFAGLTGVLLWLSSVGAGWVENWAVYRRLPEAIAQHRWGRVLGRRTMERISRWFAHNISGFGGNTTLGILLGMAAVFGKFFGLPLGVLHVTLSTGSLVLAMCTLGTHALSSPAFHHAALGILVIGALNFGVSFWLALAVAFRARGATRADRWRLLVAVIKRFFRRPFEFFYPPKAA